LRPRALATLTCIAFPTAPMFFWRRGSGKHRGGSAMDPIPGRPFNPVPNTAQIVSEAVDAESMDVL